MKIFKKVIIPFFLLGMLLISCKKETKKTNKVLEESKEIIKKSNTESLNILTPRDFARGEKSKYSHNLQVLKGESFFDKDNLDSINLKIPVPNKNYRFINAYNVLSKISPSNKKGIVIHISDDSNNYSCKDSIRYILDVKIAVKDIINYSPIKFSLEKDDKLNVIVLNDKKSDFTNNRSVVFKDLEKKLNADDIIYGCNRYKEIKVVIKEKVNGIWKEQIKIIKPQEQGGGVIVGGP